MYADLFISCRNIFDVIEVLKTSILDGKHYNENLDIPVFIEDDDDRTLFLQGHEITYGPEGVVIFDKLNNLMVVSWENYQTMEIDQDEI